MLPTAHNSSRSGLLRVALAALVEVAAVAAALGMSVGAGATVVSFVLAGALVGVLAASVVSLVHLVRHASAPPQEEAVPGVAQGEVAATSLSVRRQDAEPALAPTSVDADGPVEAPAERALPEPPGSGRGTPRTLDLAALSDTLVGTADPIGELRLFVGDIRTREADEEGDERPSPFERYAARLISEAGLFDKGADFPGVRIVRPPSSTMFYLRYQEKDLPFDTRMRLLSLEAALNALRFSSTYFDDPDAHGIEEHYQLLQKLARSITAQSPNLGENVPVVELDEADTEWAVRMGISTAFEGFQLPHRLEADWRVNVADGNVAIEVELTPEAAFPRTCYVEDLGLVSSTREMRRMAASDYALRLALLVAAAAFRSSERIAHVWVAGMSQTAKRRACYLSVDFDRWRFSKLVLADLEDLAVVYRSFAPMLRYEEGILRPVERTFALSEWRFCPPRRYESVSLSTRKIATPFAAELGTERVSGLSINEAGKRELVAARILPQLNDSTEHNVQLIMALAGDDPDPTVRSAAERTVGKLIEGTVADDAQSVGEEFLLGDALTRAVGRAEALLRHQEPARAEQALREVLDPIDEAGIYADTSNLEHRFFPNYVERALYNRLFAVVGRAPLLVPQSYFRAHMYLSFSLLMQQRFEATLVHARRLVELAPLDARAHVHLTRCLELCGRSDEAVELLNHLLTIAHDPEGIGLAYYRMAFFQWGMGNALAAQACYARALRFLPSYMPMIVMEMGTLALQSPGTFRTELTEQEVERILEEHGIPIAPTEEMSGAFFDCARASLDAEIFPVARNFAQVMAGFTGDDVVLGMIRSIEPGPWA